ncbi:MAG: GTP cyclohydrolase I FolE [Bdellovibrionales bacterium]|nr:GTP cyclohydrolase I FolE [Bdellovibrionales bacterium]
MKKNDNISEILKNVLPSPTIPSQLSEDEKVKIIEKHFVGILETLGLDLSDDSLKETPKRVAKMYVKEIFSGLDREHFPKITTIENKMSYDQMIAVQNIEVMSCCEHHLQTIQGLATVAYIPNKKVIGLSKINRIVQFFSRRPQVQERLTKQIADCLEFILETPHIAVQINAKHFCVIARGIQDVNSSTITTDVRGDFKNRPETRKEFLHSCNTHFKA